MKGFEIPEIDKLSDKGTATFTVKLYGWGFIFRSATKGACMVTGKRIFTNEGTIWQERIWSKSSRCQCVLFTGKKCFE